jgi:hypothetical protein
LQNCTEADEEYDLTLINLLNICTNAQNLIECSKAEQKRQIIKFVLSNIQLNSGKLLYELRKPFDKILKYAIVQYGTPNEIRTRVASVKGKCPRPLDDGGK